MYALSVLAPLAAGLGTSDIIPLVGILVVVALAAASSIGVLTAMRVSRQTQTISNYKNAADSAQTLVTSLQAELKEVKEAQVNDLAAARARETESAREIGELRARVQVLQDLATGATQLDQLTALTNKNQAGIQQILQKLGES